MNSRSAGRLRAVFTGAILFAAGYGLATYEPPCTSPLTYRIGQLDPRFGLSNDDALGALERAEGIWEQSNRPALFGYDEQGEVVVNFVYDNRQRVAQENSFRKDRIKRIGSRTDRLKIRHESAAARFESVKKSHLRKQSVYDAEVAAHNRTVDSWNGRGGAPPAQYEAIRRETDALKVSADALEQGRVLVNSLADRANRLSRRYNDLAGRVNSNVAAINTTAGREFKQGLFTRDAHGLRIDVFEYMSVEDLVHVLAHELGHALGLEHNDNPQAIMYGLNSSRSSTLTAEDLQQLVERCGI